MLNVRKSLAGSTLLSMALRISVIITLMSGLAYLHLSSTIAEKAKIQLTKYVEERGRREAKLFDLATQNHAVMKEAFEKQLAEHFAQQNTGWPEKIKKFDELFEQKADGTWRDRDPNIDSNIWPTYYHGNQVPMTDELKARTVLIHNFVTQYGHAYKKQFADTYLTTPENSMVLFWPGENWGKGAPSDLDMRKEEYIAVANPINNPTRATVWTGTYYDVAVKAWMASVETPVYANDQIYGTIGHDILMTELFDGTINEVLPGTSNLIFRGDGRLIAHPKYTSEIERAAGKYLMQESGNAELTQIYESIRKTPKDVSLVDWKEGKTFLGFYNIKAPTGTS
jgi:hypothetical protein